MRERHDVPLNPLHARGYPSIGCEPCTRAIKPGEPERAGRWWWEKDEKRECGLHVEGRSRRRSHISSKKDRSDPDSTDRSSTARTPDRPTIRSRPAAARPHLKALENEAIHIFREVAAEFERPVMLYSIGKDSSVLLHLARKAFYPGRVPFPLLHVDTGWKFARDDRVPRRDGARTTIST